jgi:putative flippase GtrA
MVVGWLAHRRLTFSVARAPSLKEFLSYAALQWVSVGTNYGLYAGMLLLRPATEPLVAMVAASLVAMIVSYLGMRFGVFAKH